MKKVDHTVARIIGRSVISLFTSNLFFISSVGQCCFRAYSIFLKNAVICASLRALGLAPCRPTERGLGEDSPLMKVNSH